MSDPAVDATPSTADIASQVVEQFDATEAPVETPAPEPETPPSVPAVVDPPLSEEEQLLHEHGFKQAFKPDGREHYIARSKVLKMIGTGLKRGLDKWTTEKTTLAQERDQFKADLDELYTEARGDGRAFLEKLAQHLPQYRSFLEPPKAPEPPPQALTLPEPDADWNGAKTWSMEAFQTKIIPYIIQQAEAKAEAKAKAEADAALKPFRDREQTDKITAKQRERWQQMRAEAETWPLFGKFPEDGSLTPFQQEVLDTLKADQALDLRGAYMKVALPRLTADDTKKREQWAKEASEAAGKTPTLPRAIQDTPKAVPLDTRAIAARVVERTERTGA